jgi:hypothetical protein
MIKKIILCITLLFGLLLLIFVFYRGIKIENIYNQYQNQSQSQFVFSLFVKQGNLKWETKKVSEEEIIPFIESLDSYQSLLSKIVRIGYYKNAYIIFYPIIVEEERYE